MKRGRKAVAPVVEKTDENRIRNGFGLFLPGTAPGPGRPKGSPNITPLEVKRAFRLWLMTGEISEAISSAVRAELAEPMSAKPLTRELLRQAIGAPNQSLEVSGQVDLKAVVFQLLTGATPAALTAEANEYLPESERLELPAGDAPSNDEILEAIGDENAPD